MATAARFRLSEFALHQWDAEVAFNPFAAVTPGAVALLLDQIGGMLGWTSRPQELAGREATLLVRLHAPERTFGLKLGEKVELVDAPEQPDGELVAPAEAWLRLAVGRLGSAHTPEGAGDRPGDPGRPAPSVRRFLIRCRAGRSSRPARRVSPSRRPPA
ncbi:hypothetical protein NKG94_13575 [Micromonospora sp. M12]